MKFEQREILIKYFVIQKHKIVQKRKVLGKDAKFCSLYSFLCSFSPSEKLKLKRMHCEISLQYILQIPKKCRNIKLSQLEKKKKNVFHAVEISTEGRICSLG